MAVLIIPVVGTPVAGGGTTAPSCPGAYSFKVNFYTNSVGTTGWVLVNQAVAGLATYSADAKATVKYFVGLTTKQGCGTPAVAVPAAGNPPLPCGDRFRFTAFWPLGVPTSPGPYVLTLQGMTP